MPLETEDIKLITELQSKMEDRLVTAIGGLGSGIRAKMESEVDRIEVLDEIRNGKIEENGEEIKKLKKETKIARWIQRNRRNSTIILVLFIFAVAYSYHTINFKRT
ncbi:hypothetical protein KAR91_25915, partial [Candidatus Pacearchaeota archaeon]|nr:hypothetical protein [Candidatus Pacearchaeota archaeon]